MLSTIGRLAATAISTAGAAPERDFCCVSSFAALVFSAVTRQPTRAITTTKGMPNPRRRFAESATGVSLYARPTAPRRLRLNVRQRPSRTYGPNLIGRHRVGGERTAVPEHPNSSCNLGHGERHRLLCALIVNRPKRRPAVLDAQLADPGLFIARLVVLGLFVKLADHVIERVLALRLPSNR